MSDIVIRRLTPGDWEAYRAIRLAALEESPTAFGTKLAEARRHTEAIWRSRLTTAAHFAAERDGRLIGNAGGLRTELPGTALLIGMWVSPEARGHGIGEQLARRIIEWATDDGFATLKLWVTAGNAPAERLYLRCGFTPTGSSGPIGSPEQGLRELEMELGLAPQ